MLMLLLYCWCVCSMFMIRACFRNKRAETVKFLYVCLFNVHDSYVFQEQEGRDCQVPAG